MYKCNSCGKEFFFDGQLKRHILFNHPQAEQPSSLFTEIERQVSSVIEGVPRITRRYVGYPTLESLREETQDWEDLSIDWNRTTPLPPDLGGDPSYSYTASSLQVRVHQWLVNEICG